MMSESERLHAIIRLLYEHSSPALLKFRAQTELPKLAQAVLRTAQGPSSLWKKWSSDREEVAKRAAELWLPMDDLREVLNTLPGDHLTPTDVEQRLYALRHQDGAYLREADEALKAGSLAAYAEEKAKGTEFIAILGWLEDWTLGAGERLERQRGEERRERIEQDNRNAGARLRSGADCPWTVVAGFTDQHCRKNGRLYRLRALQKGASSLAPKLEVLEIRSLDDRRGVSIGRCALRSEASKAVLEVAYKPEWQ